VALEIFLPTEENSFVRPKSPINELDLLLVVPITIATAAYALGVEQEN